MNSMILNCAGLVGIAALCTNSFSPMPAGPLAGSVYNQSYYMDTVKADTYRVKRALQPIVPDADWNKAAWKGVEAVGITRIMGDTPSFVPRVKAKMQYDQHYLYVIYQVEDRFVKSTVTEINGPVSENSCVEFFFAPDTSEPLKYFNLEINAGGTPLIFYISKPWSDWQKLAPSDISQINIAHSLPSVVDPEIEKPVTWYIECSIPLSMLEKYGRISPPAPGVKWKGNFYKTGSETSQPVYLTWSEVRFPKPNFHLPEYFGTLVFE